jgi:hypothetical protein
MLEWCIDGCEFENGHQINTRETEIGLHAHNLLITLDTQTIFNIIVVVCERESGGGTCMII